MSESGQPVFVRHDPLAALRLPEFRSYIASRLCYTLGLSIFQAVILWQVYDLSHSALKLGLLGLARLFPALCLSMVAGAVADSYNRRNIVMISQGVPFLCAIVLAISTLGGWISLPLIYGIVVFQGLSSAFEGPARQALVPSIVPHSVFQNAVVVNGNVQQLSQITGLAIGGLIIATAGIGAAYLIFAVLAALAIVLMSFVRLRVVDMPSRGLSLEAIREGISFVRNRQVLLGAMTLDMFATIFGGAKGLLPIYARDILHVGASGFGFFNAAYNGGAFLTTFLMVLRPPVQRTGRALMVTVCGFGLATIAFGLSRNFYLSLVIFCIAGAADQVSVVMRQTTLQMATPHRLRGRVSSVSQVFTQSSNQASTLESGLVAAVTSTPFSVVSGGVGALLAVVLVGWRLPQLWQFRASGMAIDFDQDEPAKAAASDAPDEAEAAPAAGA